MLFNFQIIKPWIKQQVRRNGKICIEKTFQTKITTTRHQGQKTP